MACWTFPRRIIAHRGGGKFAPENTIYAIRKGASFGFDGVEFDVMLTRDKIPVLCHDDVLSRTIVSPKHDGMSVSDIDSNELLQIDAGSWFWKDDDIEKDFSIRIPLFEDVIKHCLENNIWMDIEIKPVPGFEVETAVVVAEMTARYFPLATSPMLPMFSSFSFEALKTAYQVAPHIPRGYLTHALAHTPLWKEQMREMHAASFHIDHTELQSDEATSILEEGYPIFCFTVNDVDTALKVTGLGATAFCTDALNVFRGASY